MPVFVIGHVRFSTLLSSGHSRLLSSAALRCNWTKLVITINYPSSEFLARPRRHLQTDRFRLPRRGRLLSPDTNDVLWSDGRRSKVRHAKTGESLLFTTSRLLYYMFIYSHRPISVRRATVVVVLREKTGTICFVYSACFVCSMAAVCRFVDFYGNRLTIMIFSTLTLHPSVSLLFLKSE